MNSIEQIIERVLSIAKAEVGYLEKKSNSNLDDKTANAGSNNYTKYARDLDKLGVYNGRKNGYSWCDIFVDWVYITAFGLDTAMQITNQPKGGYGAGCTWSVKYYKSAGRFYKNKPQKGDQIFFIDNTGDFYHTGLVSSVTSDRVYTIEGNTSTSSEVVPNGGCVAEKSYPINYSKIGGYGRPDYAKVSESNLDLMEEEDMTVERFKDLWIEMRKGLRDNDASNWSSEAREWAISNGIVRGISSESINAAWEDVLTREELITFLYRFAQLIEHG